VETAYDTIKSKLQLESFSGKTVVSVLQDFYATMYLANMATFSANAADHLISEADAKKQLKYKRKANQNRGIAKFREAFLHLIFEPDEVKRNAMLDKLIKDIAKYPVSIVQKRAPKRKLPRKKRFYQTRRSILN